PAAHLSRFLSGVRHPHRPRSPRCAPLIRILVGAVYDRAFFDEFKVPFLLIGMPTPQRLAAIFDEHPIYFLTACTYNRRRILDNEAVHESFIQFALGATKRDIYVGRYVIMPDHIHLLAGFGPESPSLSIWMKSLKNTISKVLTNATFLTPHWQKGFFDHVIRSKESYDEKWLYIRENAVTAGLVRSSEEWPYAGEISDLIVTKNARS
ncbi:MAG TPA: transposase, partial [Terriglobia bacterium]|nr:transposase [Terriglobia bacterium]